MYYPDVTTSFIDDFPLEMPSLMAYPIYINSSIIVSDDLINIQQVDLLIGDETFTAEEHDGFYYSYFWPCYASPICYITCFYILLIRY